MAKKSAAISDKAAGGILCATDFSTNATDASKVAAALAARLGQPLILAHNPVMSRTDFTKKKEWEEYLEGVDRLLERHAKALAISKLLITPQRLTQATPEMGLLDLLKKSKAALCVAASVSKTTWDRWTVGSVAEAIAENSSAPTLVVRESAPLLKWAAGNATLRVFVALDFSPSANAALSWVNELRKVGPCHVTVGHVYCPPDEARARGLPSPSTFMEAVPEVQRDLEEACKKKAAELLKGGAAVIEVKPSFSRPDFPIIDMAQAAKADLVVVGTRQRRGLSRLWNASISRGILHHAKMSVAVVPAR